MRQKYLTCIFLTVTNYKLVTTGTECNRITSTAECEQAATELGLSDTTVTVVQNYYPEVADCYFWKSGSNEGLFFNTIGNASRECTSTTSQCICRLKGKHWHKFCHSCYLALILCACFTMTGNGQHGAEFPVILKQSHDINKMQALSGWMCTQPPQHYLPWVPSSFANPTRQSKKRLFRKIQIWLIIWLIDLVYWKFTERISEPVILQLSALWLKGRPKNSDNTRRVLNFILNLELEIVCKGSLL